MALPNGYTQLEYIESTGKQYINTGINSANTVRVELDFQFLTLGGWIFGARVSANNSSIEIFPETKQDYWRSIFGNKSHTIAGLHTNRTTGVVSEDVISIGDQSVTTTKNTFSSTAPIFLFALSANGTPGNYSTARMWSCKMYESGTLVRDFVPVKNDQGVAGMYDTVGNTFYPSASSTAFVAGPEYVEPAEPGTHNAKVGGAGYQVKGGTAMTGGTLYNIAKGRTLVGGTGYDINFAEVIPTAPSQSGTLKYNGTTQSPSWNDYDSQKLIIGGTTSATNAGTYTATFTPRDGFVWWDGTNTAKSVTWKIENVSCSIKITGTGTQDWAYITVGTSSTKRYTATTLSCNAGTKIKLVYTSNNESVGGIKINGSYVSKGDAYHVAYEYTVMSDVTIKLSYYSDTYIYYGLVELTTS